MNYLRQTALSTILVVGIFAFLNGWVSFLSEPMRQQMAKECDKPADAMRFRLSEHIIEESKLQVDESSLHVDDENRICTQNPYVSMLADSAETVTQRMDAWLEPSAYQAIMHEAKTNETWSYKWNPFRAFTAMTTCQASERQCVGGKCRKDESKITCGLSNLQPGCVVYSIGGNNQWAFEMDVLRKTPCSVHTFDCTGKRSRFQPPEHDRLHFHHVCLGTEYEPPNPECKEHVGGGYFPGKCGPTWTLLEMQRNLGHQHIDLYKMDIEGWEWPLFEAWPALANNSGPNQVALPMQLLVEIHYRTGFTELWKPGQKNKKIPFKDPPDMVELQRHFLRMGYVVVERDDNHMCPHCTELTLVRMRCASSSSC